MRKKKNRQTAPYSCLVDNIKVFLIFLVVFNHLIAFEVVKDQTVIRYIWYGITIFHMPAFIFVSGYLSKKPQDIMKNMKNLLVPYILGYTLTWAANLAVGTSMQYDMMRPSGSVMWYVLALFVYRMTIEAMSKIRFILPLSIIFALWAGTQPEFTTFLSTSRIVVFFPFFLAGYLWKPEHVKAVRKFKGKWILLLVVAALLYVIPNYMIVNEMPIDIFRGNHTYQICELTDGIGTILRLLMYLVSFIVILFMYAVFPDIKLPITFVGRNTMGVYLFHYPILLALDGMGILLFPQLLNVWVLVGISLLLVLLLGSTPVNWLYATALRGINWIIFKKERAVDEEEMKEALDDVDINDGYEYEEETDDTGSFEDLTKIEEVLKEAEEKKRQS